MKNLNLNLFDFKFKFKIYLIREKKYLDGININKYNEANALWTGRCDKASESDYVELCNHDIHSAIPCSVKICGKRSGLRTSYESKGNFFRVAFKSNHLYEATGFKAIYYFVQKGIYFYFIKRLILKVHKFLT